MNNQIVTMLDNILVTYQSIIAFFYQKIVQAQYSNNELAVYQIDYNLLLPSSKFITVLNSSQVNAQMQAYIDLCNELYLYIDTTIGLQTNLSYEHIQNSLNSSITQLNGFALSLLDAQYANLFNYTVEYNMSMTTAMYLNNIDLDTYLIQVQLNSNQSDFNNLLQNSIMQFTRS